MNSNEKFEMIARLANECKRLAEYTTSLQGAISNKEQYIKSCKKALDEQDTKLTDKDAEIARLKRYKASVEGFLQVPFNSAIDDVQQAINTKDDEIERLKGIIDARAEEKRRFDDKYFERLKELYEALNMDMSEELPFTRLIEAVKQSQATIKELTAERDSLIKQRDSLATQLNDQAHELEKENDKLKDQYKVGLQCNAVNIKQLVITERALEMMGDYFVSLIPINTRHPGIKETHIRGCLAKAKEQLCKESS